MEVVTDERWVDEFEAKLYELARATEKPFGDIVRSNARLLAVNLAIQTQPWSGREGNFAQLKSGTLKYSGLADRQMGEEAVARDIWRVYSSIDRVYEQIKRQARDEGAARKFYAAAINGNFDRAQRILASFRIFDRGLPLVKFDGGTAHQRRRNTRGRVGSRYAEMVVVNPKAVVNYVKKITRAVGTGKGGWAECASRLGGMRGLPQWVTRHDEHGRVDDHTRDLNNPYAVLHNFVAYLDQIIDAKGIADSARITQQKMEAQIEHVIAAAARKVGFEAEQPASAEPVTA